MKKHDVETVKLQEEFNHAAYQLQVEQDLQMKNAKKFEEIIDKMYQIHKIGLETEQERKTVYFEKLRQEEKKENKEAVKKLIDEFPKVKLFQESDFIDNSMHSTADESLISNQSKAPPKSEYDMVKQEMINFQKQIST